MFDYLNEKIVGILGPYSPERAKLLEKEPLPSYNYNDPEAIEWAMQAYYYDWSELTFYCYDISAKVYEAFKDLSDNEYEKRFCEYIDWAFDFKSDKNCWQRNVLNVHDTMIVRNGPPTNKFVHDFTPPEPWWENCPLEYLWGHDPETLMGLSREEIMIARPDIYDLGAWIVPPSPLKSFEDILDTLVRKEDNNEVT